MANRKLTVEISEDEYRKVKYLAERNDCGISHVVRELINVAYGAKANSDEVELFGIIGKRRKK